MIEPPWLRIGSISSGFGESNTSHTVSARRKNAAGVAVAKENIRCRPSLSRLALTGAALSAARTQRQSGLAEPARQQAAFRLTAARVSTFPVSAPQRV